VLGRGILGGAICLLLGGLALGLAAGAAQAGEVPATATAWVRRSADDTGLHDKVFRMRSDGQSEGFTFAVTTDMRMFAGPGQYDTPAYFRGAAEAVAALGGGAFMITPGDIDPTVGVMWSITRTLGDSYTWYPVVGNHELPGAGSEASWGANLDWLLNYDYGDVNPGPTGCPTTTYSFDYGTAHFVVLNEYCDSPGDPLTQGDVPDHLYDWLANDLGGTAQEHVFVVGHEPAYPQPDADNGRVHHLGDSLDQYPDSRDRFWTLLRDRGVAAYVCGHTHNYSAVNVGGVWQLDAGHARGLGDTGARSTFVMVHVTDDAVTFETYRDDASGGEYVLVEQGHLWLRPRVYLPAVMGESP
jgi:hypothetical protein